MEVRREKEARKNKVKRSGRLKTRRDGMDRSKTGRSWKERKKRKGKSRKTGKVDGTDMRKKGGRT